MQRSSVLLPDPDAPISATAEPLGHVEIDAVEHRSVPNSLTTPRSAIFDVMRPPSPTSAGARAASRWSVRRVSGIDTHRNSTAATTYGVKLNMRSLMIVRPAQRFDRPERR